MDTLDFATRFRQAAPYIRNLRNKTIVLAVSSHLLREGCPAPLAQDLQLLVGLGVKVVLVHGIRAMLDETMLTRGETPHYLHNRRVTNEAALNEAKALCGRVRFDLEAALSIVPAQGPNRSSEQTLVVGGNFFVAQPLGVINGCDMGYTGSIRKINVAAIETQLTAGHIVLISPLGQTLSGQTLNLALDDIASSLAIALKAEKLLILSQRPLLLDKNNKPISELTIDEAREKLQHHSEIGEPSDSMKADEARFLQVALDALSGGVLRVHILSNPQSDSLLSELFTRKGVGTSLAAAPFTRIRPATLSDIGDMLQLIRPLESNGTLVFRAQHTLETHIHEFFVLEKDYHLYGCAALKTLDSHAGEIACLAVEANERGKGYGELLLQHIVNQAKNLQLSTLFALSTRTGEWFYERGFREGSACDLPPQREREYHAQNRRSKIYRLDLLSD